MPNKVREYKDNAHKMVFSEPILFAQFLNDYVALPALKGIKPEAIENIKERFLPIDEDAVDADTVNRIRIDDETRMYVITIVEHESQVNYRMPFKLLKYITHAWSNYEKEMKSKHGSSIVLQKEFQYPPVVPIVYYEGRKEWTAVQSMKDKVYMGEMFAQVIPDFRYHVVELNKYTTEQLKAFENAMAFILMLDKASHSKDISQLVAQLSNEGFIDRLEQNTSDYLMGVLENILNAYMTNAELSNKEISRTANNFRNGRLNNMLAEFAENFQKEKEEERRIGREEANLNTAKKLLKRGMPTKTISDITELPPERIQALQKELGIRKHDGPVR